MTFSTRRNETSSTSSSSSLSLSYLWFHPIVLSLLLCLLCYCTCLRFNICSVIMAAPKNYQHQRWQPLHRRILPLLLCCCTRLLLCHCDHNSLVRLLLYAPYPAKESCQPLRGGLTLRSALGSRHWELMLSSYSHVSCHIRGTVTTEMENMNELVKLLCTFLHTMSVLFYGIFIMYYYLYIFVISTVWGWRVFNNQYLTTLKPCESLNSKFTCLYTTTNLRVLFPLKLGTWVNLVIYYVHIVSINYYICSLLSVLFEVGEYWLTNFLTI